MILPQPILDGTRLGCFNLHASLLPRWRGAAPINRAIMAGDDESGVMVMKMDAGLDTGDVAMVGRVTVTDSMTASDLHDVLAQAGAGLMVRAMTALERGELKLTPQDADGVTYAAKIAKEEARIDWTRPAREVLRHCHGLSPFPGAWSEIDIDGQPVRLKILRCELARGHGAPGELIDTDLTVACGDGAVRIVELQRAGKQPMTAEVFLRGTRLPRREQDAMIIRPEKLSDAAAIGEVVAAAFGQPAGGGARQPSARQWRPGAVARGGGRRRGCRPCGVLAGMDRGRWRSLPGHRPRAGGGAAGAAAPGHRAGADRRGASAAEDAR